MRHRKIRRMPHDELVDRRAARDENCSRAFASRPAHRRAAMLPRSCPVAGHHAHIERTDVDAELERVGRDNRLDQAIAQFLFDLPTALWKITSSVAANPVAIPCRPVEIILEIGGKDFGREALARRRSAACRVSELARNASCLGEVRPPDSKLPIHDGGLTNTNAFSPLGAPCSKPVRTAALPALLRARAGCNRCRGADERGI